MSTQSPETNDINLAVGGMTCAGCASNIQRGLSHLPGVDDAVVNLATRRATVRPDGTVDPEELDRLMRSAITGLGYQVLTPEVQEQTQTQAREHNHEQEHQAHLRSDAARVADYRRRFLVAAILTVPLLAISMIPAVQFPGWGWVAAALATPVTFYSGWPFHRSTAKGARHGAVNMDTLVTLGTLAAWAWSMVELARDAVSTGADAMGGMATDPHLYFETGAVIITLILLGKWLEVRSTSQAGDAIRALSSRQSATARLEDGRQIDRTDLAVGMRFITRPGEIIATDGVVVEGAAAVDASLVTGESVPVHATEGDEVIGGTIATDGALTIEATRVGSETMLAQIARLVDQAQSGRARVQRLADRISAIFVPIVILLAVGTLATWLITTGDADRAFTAAVAVLIISCPCALGLATPLAIMVGTGRGAQLGVLVRGPQVLEDTRSVHTIVLDKTGTVTEGRMELVEIHAPDLTPADAEALLDAVASVEARSEHPIAAAIAASRTGRIPLKGFRAIPGQGAAATVQGVGVQGVGAQGPGAGTTPDAEVTVGSRRLFDTIPDELEALARTAEQAGRTAVFAGRAAPAAGGIGGLTVAVRAPLTAEVVLAVADTLKPTAAEAITAFRELGLEVVLLTGDNERAARAVGDALGIGTVIAEVLPGEKAATIQQLQAQGKRVAMVGDGINDAPALAQADLGIAIGTGADVAREASDLTVVSGDPRAVADAIALSRRTLGIIRGNLFWAFAYNVAAIPLAAFGILNPMIAAAAMGTSSLFVVGNSLRLRRFTGYRR